MTATCAYPEDLPNSSRDATVFFVAEPFAEAVIRPTGLTSLEAVFAFESGARLVKLNLGRFRRRVQFAATPTGSTDAGEDLLETLRPAADPPANP